MIDTLLGLIAPHSCSSCGHVGAILCDSCVYNIVSEPFCGCLLCLHPCGDRGACPSCARAVHVEQAWCVGVRSGALKKLLDQYKFSASRAASGACFKLLDATIPQLPAKVVVVPVPSSPHSVRQRGFGHVERFARQFAKRRGLAYAEPLQRASNVTLHFLSKKERALHADGLFQLSGETVPDTVLLLDDIVTTGTTLRTALRELRRAGAKYLYVAAVAHQPQHDETLSTK